MLNRKIYPYKKAVLRDRKGDIKKRWHIKFSVFDVSKNRMVDKYDIHFLHSKPEKLIRLCQVIVETI